ncbi:hypothetical protein GCM10027406_37840 [Leifsonia lichenia]
MNVALRGPLRDLLFLAISVIFNLIIATHAVIHVFASDSASQFGYVVASLAMVAAYAATRLVWWLFTGTSVEQPPMWSRFVRSWLVAAAVAGVLFVFAVSLLFALKFSETAGHEVFSDGTNFWSWTDGGARQAATVGQYEAYSRAIGFVAFVVAAVFGGLFQVWLAVSLIRPGYITQLFFHPLSTLSGRRETKVSRDNWYWGD